MIQNIIPIARKEMRHVLRDPRTLGVLVFIPIFLLLMFGFAISLDVKHIQLAAIDYDHTNESRSLLQKITSTQYFDWKGCITDPDRIDYLLDSGSVQCVLQIPRGYAENIQRGTTTTLQVLIDGSNANIGATAMGYVNRVVKEVSVDILGGSSSIAAAGNTIDFRPRIWFNPELHSPVYLIPGLISLILVVTAVISTAMSIVREKEHGTMEQLIVAPIHPVQLVVGKTIPYTILSVLIAALVLAAGAIIFDITISGSIWSLILVTFIFLLGCLGLGLFISTIADSQQVAFMISTIITLLPTFILSGFIFPISNMPVFVRVITYIIPARYYLEALRGIMLKGAPLGAFLPEIAALSVIAVVLPSVSALRMKKGGLS